MEIFLGANVLGLIAYLLYGRVKSRLGSDTVYKYPDVKVTTFKGTVQLRAK